MPSTTPPPSTLPRPGRARLAGLAALALAGVACGGATPAPPLEPPAVSARLASAERLALPRAIEVFGAVEAERTAVVSSRVAARVTAVPVRLGQEVAAGQLLVAIDPQASAGQLAQARGGLAQAESALALAERNRDRYRGLAAREAASAVEVDLAETQAAQAAAMVGAARGAVEAAAAVAGDARVVAPFAGRVARRLVEVGDLAAPGRPLIEVESTAGRHLVLSVPESAVALSGLAVGATLPVRLDARPELGEIAAEVVEMAPGADPGAHAFTVKLALAGAAAETPVGAAGRASIELRGTGRETVLVPAEAVIARGGLTLVVVRDTTGRARSRLVSTGARRGDGRVEILSGLAGGEQVLLGLAEPPPAGSPVEPAAAAGAGAAAGRAS